VIQNRTKRIWRKQQTSCDLYIF